MPPLEGDEEVKLEPQETERVKLKSRERKKRRNRIKNFNSKQITN